MYSWLSTSHARRHRSLYVLAGLLFLCFLVLMAWQFSRSLALDCPIPTIFSLLSSARLCCTRTLSQASPILTAVGLVVFARFGGSCCSWMLSGLSICTCLWSSHGHVVLERSRTFWRFSSFSPFLQVMVLSPLRHFRRLVIFSSFRGSVYQGYQCSCRSLVLEALNVFAGISCSQLSLFDGGLVHQFVLFSPFSIVMVLQFSYGVVSQGSHALGVLASLSHPVSTALRHNNVAIPAFL